MKDLAGKSFNKWTVLEYLGTRGNKYRAYWLCRCECGTVREARQDGLLNGHNKSCGCWRKEAASLLFSKHGVTRGWRNRESPAEYKVWASMRARCSNPNHKHYARYGGRGISVAKQWDDFAQFFADMGTRPTALHTIDRIDNDKSYGPDNCRWATMKEQSVNKSSNTRITLEGVTQTASQWAEQLGTCDETIRARLKRGWSAAAALFCPTSKLQ